MISFYKDVYLKAASARTLRSFAYGTVFWKKRKPLAVWQKVSEKKSIGSLLWYLTPHPGNTLQSTAGLLA